MPLNLNNFHTYPHRSSFHTPQTLYIQKILVLHRIFRLVSILLSYKSHATIDFKLDIHGTTWSTWSTWTHSPTTLVHGTYLIISAVTYMEHTWTYMEQEFSTWRCGCWFWLVLAGFGWMFRCVFRFSESKK